MSEQKTAWRTDAIQKLVKDRNLKEKASANIHPSTVKESKMNEVNHKIMEMAKKGKRVDMKEWKNY